MGAGARAFTKIELDAGILVMLIIELELGMRGIFDPGLVSGILDILVTILAKDILGILVETGLPVDIATDLGTGSVGRETEIVVRGMLPT